MKNVFNLVFVFFLVTLSTSCSTDSIDDSQEVAETIFIPQSKTIELEIMELINEYRSALDLNILGDHNIVKAQAYKHTDYMVTEDDVSHANFYSRKTYLMNNAGAQVVAENVAYGFTSAQSVVNAWINSEGHKENIEGDFTHFDVSAEQNAEGDWFFTNIFIKK
ncbi:CAP domain-containing protein [Lacinutrix neustonica]|uniref:CAP domain-containing protein n=1 Tax=Lacinutrix neustonica TaxID=2980107 RepID=A0A9E8SE69_9FLAO|nr:CAP domain-containing protein [Lacinutrix neustonica]WAC02856.1 CAP domain-containing protein [Lacinutrix neustonica]